MSKFSRTIFERLSDWHPRPSDAVSIVPEGPMPPGGCMTFQHFEQLNQYRIAWWHNLKLFLYWRSENLILHSSIFNFVPAEPFLQVDDVFWFVHVNVLNLVDNYGDINYIVKTKTGRRYNFEVFPDSKPLKYGHCYAMVVMVNDLRILIHDVIYDSTAEIFVDSN